MTTRKPFWKQSNVRGGLVIAGFGFVLWPFVGLTIQLVWGAEAAGLWVTSTTIGAMVLPGDVRIPALTTGQLIGLAGALWLLAPKILEAWREWRGGVK